MSVPHQTVERVDAPMPSQNEMLDALRLADRALREVYIRTGDTAAARARDVVFEIVYRAERAALRRDDGKVEIREGA